MGKPDRRERKSSREDAIDAEHRKLAVAPQWHDRSSVDTPEGERPNYRHVMRATSYGRHAAHGHPGSSASRHTTDSCDSRHDRCKPPLPLPPPRWTRRRRLTADPAGAVPAATATCLEALRDVACGYSSSLPLGLGVGFFGYVADFWKAFLLMYSQPSGQFPCKFISFSLEILCFLSSGCEYEGGRLPHPAPSESGRVGVLLGLRLRLTSGAFVAVDSAAALAARGEPAAR